MSIITILLWLLPFTSSDTPECSGLKTGKFRLVSEVSGTTIITRTATSQIESNEEHGVEVSYAIKWLNECTYQLFAAKVHKGDLFYQGNTTDTLTVEITTVNPDFYEALTTSNFSDLSTRTRLEILE